MKWREKCLYVDRVLDTRSYSGSETLLQVGPATPLLLAIAAAVVASAGDDARTGKDSGVVFPDRLVSTGSEAQQNRSTRSRRLSAPVDASVVAVAGCGVGVVVRVVELDADSDTLESDASSSAVEMEALRTGGAGAAKSAGLARGVGAASSRSSGSDDLVGVAATVVMLSGEPARTTDRSRCDDKSLAKCSLCRSSSRGSSDAAHGTLSKLDPTSQGDESREDSGEV